VNKKSLLVGIKCSFLALAVLLTTSAAARAQMAPYSQAGPLPPTLRLAHSIFVSNAGSDSGLFPEPFSGDPDRAYTEFYGALKQSGQFQLVNTPSSADLVLELQLTAPYGPFRTSSSDSITLKASGTSNAVPMFRLVIYDSKTHFILWTITQSVDFAALQKNHDRNFDAALTAVLHQFGLVTGRPL
jgi:hypothetical protein